MWIAGFVHRSRRKGGEGNKIKRGGNAQVIPPYSRTEDAYGEKITTQTRVSTENAGDCLVVVFFNVVSQSEPDPGEGKV